ncbi:MAG: 50S ribosome-binding GTPase [Planctomycetales bacterium]|nr:50S ribosome-binding GTPase [Planctomycetales bacterium]
MACQVTASPTSRQHPPRTASPVAANIAARLTAEIPAALATLAVRGPQAVQWVSRFTRLPADQLTVGSVRFGLWLLQAQQHGLGPAGEQVVVCRTAEEVVEIHCHGGNAVCRAILADLTSAGCQHATQGGWPSEFACPLAQAAELDLLRTTTDRAAQVLLDQLSGAFSRAIDGLLGQLSRREWGAAVARLRTLLSRADVGQHLARPWKIVLAGPPNVGKSSLLNALSGSRQSIVHHAPGTTRDWLECQGAIEGWPVAFTDTAGVRETNDPIEQQGVDRSSHRLRQADLAILVVDATVGWGAIHDQLQALSPARQLIVWNKVDLTAGQAREPHPLPQDAIATSACGSPGVSDLLTAIGRSLVPQAPGSGTAVPFRAAHREQLEACLSQLRAQQPQAAIESLRQLLANSPSSSHEDEE